MKKQSSSKSGFINSRNLVAVLFCTAGVSLPTLSCSATALSHKTTSKQQTTTSQQPVHGPASPVSPNAPTPPSGTLSPSNPTITYTDGPLITNTTGLLGPPVCSAPGLCSDFMLTV